MDKPWQHTTKATADQCEWCPTVQGTGDDNITRVGYWTSATQQDHWRSTHDTEDNITTGRDVPRTDGSATTTTFFQGHDSVHDRTGKTSSLITSGTTARNNVQGLTFHDEHVLLTVHVSKSRWLTDLSGQHLTDWLVWVTSRKVR